MRKLSVLFLVLAMALPVLVKGAEITVPRSFSAYDSLTAEEKQIFEGKTDVSVGSENVYVSKDLSQASFTKSKICPVKYSLYYISSCKDTFKRRPGLCPCGEALIPAIKHGKDWYYLSRDERGSLVIKLAGTEKGSEAPKSDCSKCNACSK